MEKLGAYGRQTGFQIQLWNQFLVSSGLRLLPERPHRAGHCGGWADDGNHSEQAKTIDSSWRSFLKEGWRTARYACKNHEDANRASLLVFHKLELGWFDFFKETVLQQSPTKSCIARRPSFSHEELQSGRGWNAHHEIIVLRHGRQCWSTHFVLGPVLNTLEMNAFVLHRKPRRWYCFLLTECNKEENWGSGVEGRGRS